MNNLAFQIYGLKKTGIFQSTWDTTLVSALGGEQAAISATGTNWALNTGATNLNVGGYKHTAGSTTNLTTTLSAAIMQMYKITYTISSRTAGSVTINYGGVSTSGITSSASVDILAIATTVFSITPTSDFDGVISISVKQTSSATNQVKLPLPNIGTYNIWVDWGDGTYDNITSWNSIKTLHTYPVGITTPTIRISGSRFNWSPGVDALKIKSVSSWGKLILANATFAGCANVTMSGITDIPDLTGVTSFSNTFNTCTSLTTIGRINEWNTSSITSIVSFCQGSTFSQSLNGWNTSNITNLSQAFINCIFNGDISAWDVSQVTNMSGMFHNNITFNQPLANWERSTPGNTSTLANVTNMAGMFGGGFTGTRQFNQDIGSWNVSKVTSFVQFFGTGNSVNLFNNGGSPSINNWSINTLQPVSFAGMFIRCPNFNQPLNLWNTSAVNNMNSMFAGGSTSFNNGFASGIANQLPWNTSNVIDMATMFSGTTAFNSNLGTGTTPWDVSKVTSFASMFNGATKFTNGDDSAPINNWSINTVSNVSMNSMFMGASIFNRDISNWNMTKVNHIGFMFNTATAFNQPVGNWERTGSTLGNVTTMRQTFRFTNFFNQDISNWNVNKVTDFGLMFNAAIAFNNGSNSNTNPVTSRTGIDGWDINTVSNVNMESMFASASIFNRIVENWNMTKVINTGGMFANALQFNQPISNWERSGSTTGNITVMTSMFSGANVFNQPIDNWNVSGVTSMDYMFQQASAFNQTLSNWERVGSTLANVLNMNYMFQSSAFNQNIGNWNVSKVASFIGFMSTKTPATFSSTNLDAIYNGWIVNGVKPNINISFGTAKYTAAGAIGRATLAAPPNGTGTWTITDGGQI